MERKKYEAVAIDLRQVADKIWDGQNNIPTQLEKIILSGLFLILNEEDHKFIDQCIKIKKYKEYIEKTNANKS